VNHNDVVVALRHLYPGRDAEWLLRGDSVEGLEWSLAESKPTQEDLESVLPAALYMLSRSRIEQERRNAYAEASDPVFFSWQRGEAEQQDWLDAVKAVKDQYPYPPAPETE